MKITNVGSITSTVEDQYYGATKSNILKMKEQWEGLEQTLTRSWSITIRKETKRTETFEEAG